MTEGWWAAGSAQVRAGPSPPGALLDVLGVAAVVLDAEGRIVLWSPQAEALFGYTAGEALGAFAGRLLVSEENLEQVIDLFSQVMEGGGPWAGVFPVRCKDGSTRSAEFRNMRLEDRDGHFFALGLATDQPTLRQVERDLAVSLRLVAQTPIGIGVLDTQLRFITVNPALERLNGLPAAEHVGRHVRDAVPFLDTEDIENTMGEVLATGKPVLDRFTVGRTPADPATEHAWRVSYHCLEDSAGNVLGLATSVVDCTEEYRTRNHMALLADASKRIGTTLDTDTTARELAEVCVPDLADSATVDLLALVTDDNQIESRPENPHDFHPAATASTTGSPSSAPARIVAGCIDTGCPLQLYEGAAGTSGQAAAPGTGARSGGKCCRLVVPLIAHGEVIGALDLARSRESAGFDQDALALTQEIASRAAVCLDNAHGYQQQRQAALALQRHLLPHRPPQHSGLSVAYRYRPARAASAVGGDWFDVIATPHQTTTLVIGDVMGSGLSAAGTMGQLRTAIRILATLGLDPARILQHVDINATGLEHGIATCTLAVYDPRQATCCIATAGHLPPVHLHGQQPTLLDLPTGAPLGVGGVSFHTTHLRLAPGDRLVLYTDGLIETRDEPIDCRLDMLLRTLRGAPTGVEAVCNLLMDTLHIDDLDDATLLVAQVPLNSPPAEDRP
ncbi:SpoIIE family protein phosphatase [Streptomyces sp. NPDC048434]|uniref:SpoIIE family protein phosphatase n=1 Tax=Streptomyces sp. NPDC048434 TaxID=3365549 RepID=UPI003720F114